MWEVSRKVKNSCSENAGLGEGWREGVRKDGKAGKWSESRHSIWEVSTKLKTTCSENAGRGGWE